MRRLAFPLLLAASLAVPAFAERKEKAPDETKGREKIAALWTDLATWAKDRGLKALATEALAEAREARPDLPDAKALEEAIAALAEDAPVPPEAKSRREKAGKDAAKLWEKLAEAHGDASDPAYVQHLLKALSLEASKPRLERLAGAAKKNSIVVRAPAHPMTAWLSLPDGWKAGKTYPVLVSCEGAGANFQGNHGGFKGARGARDVIVLTPFALSSTNELPPAKFPHYPAEVLKANEAQGSRVDWDNDGLLGLLDLLRVHFGADQRVMITGFSGGGMLCYSFTMRHPDRVRLCAPACPNFNASLTGNAPAAPDPAPVVRIFTGEKDEHRDHVFSQRPGIEGQTDQAVETFERLGYKDLKRTMLPGVGHSTCVPQVWGAVDEVLGGAKRK